MIRRYVQETIRKFHELLDAKDAPHSVAGGTAVGVFFGFLPIFGFKTLAAMGAALATRCSVVAAVIGVSAHDVLLPLWPLILRWQFQVGFWILSSPHHFAPPLTKQDFHFSEIFQWDNFIDIGLPLLVGGAVFALPIAGLSYAVVLRVMYLRARRRAERGEVTTESKPATEDPAP